MRRIIDDINNWLDSICDDIKNKKWVRGIAKSLLVLAIMACTVYFLYILILFLIRNMDYIILCVGGIVCLIVFFRSLATKKLPKQEVPPVEPQQNYIQFDSIALEETYKLIRDGLCYVVWEKHEGLGVRRPTSSSQLDAPTHHDIVANVPIYHFLVAKYGESHDTYTIMGILQSTLEKKLNNNEIPGISNVPTRYNGQLYPAVMVDNVIDYGDILQIDIALTNEYYCKYRTQRILNSMNASTTSTFKDRDF